ncbi:hypothetical protein [Trinickia sp. EG282A]|uniref:hypothetical protein n=1 Tax=Trinickia sp. EG282A TaxID=3237013 RepID=UPI0034D27BE9
MTRAQPTPEAPAPGAGTMFALRAIGLVLLARWLYSMSEMGYGASFSAMTSSPWASINAVLIFLLMVLPGAQARADRPFHPLPQWLRQALRFFAFLGLLFALWSIGVFVWAAGGRRTVHAIAETNGWLVVAPALYAAVLWICRPRALWRTNIAARRFAIGRYAVALDPATRTVVVWVESRKLGQYDARELSVNWPAAEALEREALMPQAAGHPGAQVSAPDVDSSRSVAASPEPVDSPRSASAASPRPGVGPRGPGAAAHGPRTTGRARRSRVELLWDSPAAAGHNRETVFRVALTTEGDRAAARALDATLRRGSHL